MIEVLELYPDTWLPKRYRWKGIEFQWNDCVICEFRGEKYICCFFQGVKEADFKCTICQPNRCYLEIDIFCKEYTPLKVIEEMR